MISNNGLIIYEAIYNAIVENNTGFDMRSISQKLYDTLSKLNEISIKVYCESPDYYPPEYSFIGEDACMDLKAVWIEKKIDRVICHTGLHIELPKNYQLSIYPRSSLTKCGWYLPNSPGIIDSGYRGEILVVFRHPNGMDREEFPFKEGDRIAQCQAISYQTVKWDRVPTYEDLTPSKRGDGGYGHTGK